MNPKNTLCLIVDIQERLLPALSGADEMLERCRLLIQGLTALDVPFAVTEQYPKGLGNNCIRRIAAVARRHACCRENPISRFYPKFMKYYAKRQSKTLF